MVARPDLPSTSTTSVDRPARAAARASVAVTTVLPTPPFPATMTNRDAAKNRAGSKYDLPDRGKAGLNGTPQDESEATQGHRRARAHGTGRAAADRTRVVSGKGGAVRVDRGGRRLLKTKITHAIVIIIQIIT